MIALGRSSEGLGTGSRNPGQGMHQTDRQLPARRRTGQLCSDGGAARRWFQLERPMSQVPRFWGGKQRGAMQRCLPWRVLPADCGACKSCRANVLRAGGALCLEA